MLDEDIPRGRKTRPERPDADPLLIADRYRAVRQLGQGGMGVVWLAEDTKLNGREVAVKMLPSVLLADRRAYEQVKAEALVSLKLSHTNIATVHSFEETGGNPFLVMRYIDGRTLEDYLGEHGPLSERETVALLGPVADALDYAHRMGIVHRDVKPGNVMLARDGTPYVLDFGIAREIRDAMTRVTRKDDSGTLQYMSPEQLKGAEPEPTQDVYSFAAMAYECLTGHPPFTRGRIEYQIVNTPPVPLAPSIGIGKQIMSGLAKRADGRPSSCRALLTAGTVPSSGLPTAVPSPAHGRKAVPIVFLCVLAAVSVGTVVLWAVSRGGKGAADEQPVCQPTNCVPPEPAPPEPAPPAPTQPAPRPSPQPEPSAKPQPDELTFAELKQWKHVSRKEELMSYMLEAYRKKGDAEAVRAVSGMIGEYEGLKKSLSACERKNDIMEARVKKRQMLSVLNAFMDYYDKRQKEGK